MGFQTKCHLYQIYFTFLTIQLTVCCSLIIGAFAIYDVITEVQLKYLAVGKIQTAKCGTAINICNVIMP